MAWPIFKLKIFYRIIIGIAIWILNQFLLVSLLPYQGKANLLGVLFHIFYHSLDLDVILSFFPFFLFGGILGELIFKIYQKKDTYLIKKSLKKNLIYPGLIVGILLIILGISIRFPQFLVNRSFSWMIYTLGIDICLLIIFIIFEEYIHIKKRTKNGFLFYFSYYSLTVYLAHNLLYFLFYQQLTIITIWFFIIGVYIGVGYLLKVLYNKFGAKISLKYQLGRMARALAKRRGT